jgi:hypothetical protein
MLRSRPIPTLLNFHFKHCILMTKQETRLGVIRICRPSVVILTILRIHTYRLCCKIILQLWFCKSLFVENFLRSNLGIPLFDKSINIRIISRVAPRRYLSVHLVHSSFETKYISPYFFCIAFSVVSFWCTTFTVSRLASFPSACTIISFPWKRQLYQKLAVPFVSSFFVAPPHNS